MDSGEVSRFVAGRPKSLVTTGSWLADAPSAHLSKDLAIRSKRCVPYGIFHADERKQTHTIKRVRGNVMQRGSFGPRDFQSTDQLSATTRGRFGFIPSLNGCALNKEAHFLAAGETYREPVAMPRRSARVSSSASSAWTMFFRRPSRSYSRHRR